MASGRSLPSVVHTSVQIRSVRSANRALAEAGRSWIPARRTWRLNERHYGALQGTELSDALQMYGPGPGELWDRFLDVAPPAAGAASVHRASDDVRYAALSPAALPAAESFRDVERRVLPYWHDAIVSDLRSHASVLVVAHDASLLAIVGHIEAASPTQLREVQLPPGVPIVYDLDDDLRPTAPGRRLAASNS